MMSRTSVWLCAILAIASPAAADSDRAASDATSRVEIYKTPTCGCCTLWAEHLEANGFATQVVDRQSLDAVKRRGGIPTGSEACHTAFVDGYVIEGHVPAEDVKRLLQERPDVVGLVVPGMPPGSPGMEGPVSRPYTVYSFDRDGDLSVFARHE